MKTNPYKNLTTQELLTKTHEVVKIEREAQVEVIRLLAEVDRRRLWASLGFRSLFNFCVKELGYSESAAWRRVSAMRLIDQIPEAESKLISGSVSLKSLTSLQNFLNTEERNLNHNFTMEQKREILKSIENKTGRETDTILASLSPIPAPPDERERPLNGKDFEIRFVAGAPLVGKLHRLKDLNSHRDPSRSYRGLFEWLTDLGLKTADPLTKNIDSHSKTTKKSDENAATSTRYISSNLKYRVWQRDGGRCTYVDPGSGRRCDSTSFIEIDHILPLALGGKTEIENLRLYCNTHNLEAAKTTFGASKIAGHIQQSSLAKKPAPEKEKAQL